MFADLLLFFDDHVISIITETHDKQISVSSPNFIKVYNVLMGGGDRSDQKISLYRVSIRGKKWYFPLISYCIDMSVQNTWHLHREQGNLNQLEFRRNIACNLLET